MSRFKIGDKVTRNQFIDDEYDGNQIKYGWSGVIVEYDTTYWPNQPYRVLFDNNILWWIRPECIEFWTEKDKQIQILEKIKYLDTRFKNRKTLKHEVSS